MAAAKPQQRVEVKRIAQVLNLDERELRYLQGLSQADLQKLYGQIEGAVSGVQSPLWPALAKSVRFFPNRLCAKITQEAFGPYIAAQMTRHLDSKTAIGIGKHFSPQFLAEVFQHIEAAEASTLLGKLPMSNLKKAVLFMLADQQYQQLGSVMEHLAKDRILALAREIDSPRALLKIANAVEHKGKLADAFAQLSDEQVSALIEAASELELWEPALQICSHMTPRHQRRVAQLAREFEWDDIDQFRQMADELNLREKLAPLFSEDDGAEPLLGIGRLLPGRLFRKS